jgi:ABC-type multidrug transport system ATPase subunit
MDILANRKTVGSITGDILFNGHKRTRSIDYRSAYVLQDSVFIGVLTVYQTLYYAALLRMHQSKSLQEKIQRVSNIMRMLGLQEHANTIVGNAKSRGISG